MYYPPQIAGNLLGLLFASAETVARQAWLNMKQAQLLYPLLWGIHGFALLGRTGVHVAI